MVENEIQYLPWQQFRQMVPPILGLEVRRLSRHIADADPSSDTRNQLVKTRFELRRFITCVEKADEEERVSCGAFLDAALLNVAAISDRPEMDYVIDRLRYVRDRIPYVY